MAGHSDYLELVGAGPLAYECEGEAGECEAPRCRRRVTHVSSGGFYGCEDHCETIERQRRIKERRRAEARVEEIMQKHRRPR